MKKIALLTSVLLGILLTSACSTTSTNSDSHPETITGDYKIIGWEPGTDFNSPPNYLGTAEIHEKGENFAYTAKIHWADPNRKELFSYKGPCIYDEKTHSISLTWEDNHHITGSSILVKTYKGFDVKWIYSGDEQQKSGKEIWEKID